MSSSPTLESVADRRSLWAAATEALAGLREVLWQAHGNELAAMLGDIDRLAALAAGARVALVAEAETRGEIGASQAGSVTAWVAGHAPSLAAGGAGQVARLVHDTRTAELAPVRDAVIEGTVAVPVALTVVSEWRKLRPRLHDGAAPTVLEGLLTMGASDGARGVRALRPALLATYGLDGEFQHDADTAAGLISLSRPVGDDLAGYTYQLTLDPIGSATLEAAIGPLSKPVLMPDGSRDTRCVQLRRGQALVELVRRATAAGDRPPAGAKTTLILTMPYDDLKDRVAAATVLGAAAGGTLLAPDTVRKLACDADLIPAVLGTTSQVLDLGHTTRLATPAQLMALWLRDRHCTFPGCTTPAHWCDAHHLVHWADGGPTTLANLALLCGRHHTIAHRDALIGCYDPDTGFVAWDTTPGSYRVTALPGVALPGVARPGVAPPGGVPPGAAPPVTRPPRAARPDEAPAGAREAAGQSGGSPREPPPVVSSGPVRGSPECDPWHHPAESVTAARHQTRWSATGLLQGQDDPWHHAAEGLAAALDLGSGDVDVNERLAAETV